MRRNLLLLILIGILTLVACTEDDEALSADAGDDFTVPVGEAPTFNGCDSTGDITNYQWVILEAPESQSEDDGKFIREVETACEFTLEDTMILQEAGEWAIELTVSNDDGDTASDTVRVTVATPQEIDGSAPVNATEDANN